MQHPTERRRIARDTGAEISRPEQQALASPTSVPVASPAIDTRELHRSGGRGALWRIAGGMWATFIRLGASMFLARYLSPADFGIVGMAVLTRDFVLRFGGLGMGSGILAKRHLTQADLSTAFWTDASVRIFLFLVTVAAAPLVAIGFRAEGLAWVIRAVAVTFLFSAFSSVSGSLLARRGQFGRQELIYAVGAAVESALAVALVLWTDLAYWSLVIAMIVTSLLIHAGTILAARWRPNVHFNRSSFRFQFRFGAYGLASSIVDYLEENIDYITIGRLFGQTKFGYYEFAFRIPTLIYSRVIRPVGGVLFPTLSRAQSDLELVGRGFLKATRLAAIMVWPALAMLAALAWPTVYIVWGSKWLMTVPLLQILCVVAAMNSVCSSACPTFMVLHRPDLGLKISIPRAVMSIITVVTMGLLWGVTGVAIAMAFNSTYYFLVAWRVGRLCQVPYRKVLTTLIPPSVVAAVAGACAWTSLKGISLTGAGPLVGMLTGIGCGLIGWLLVLRLVFVNHWNEIKSLLCVTLPNSKS